ncbi:type II toxin-antitoxin system PemK/MazF family toxin [Leucobacter sp.]
MSDRGAGRPGGALLEFLRSFATAFLDASRRSGAADAVRSSSPPAVPGGLGRGQTTRTRDLTPAEIRELRPSYSPQPDGDPDPGEVVWAWVPYAENDGRGKDRPVLIVARIDARTTAGCYLSTKQHRGFVSVGTGGWDGQGRESFLAPDRVLRISDEDMRREGHVLARDRFARAVETVVRTHAIRG